MEVAIVSSERRILLDGGVSRNGELVGLAAVIVVAVLIFDGDEVHLPLTQTLEAYEGVAVCYGAIIDRVRICICESRLCGFYELSVGWIHPAAGSGEKGWKSSIVFRIQECASVLCRRFEDSFKFVARLIRLALLNPKRSELVDHNPVAVE